MEFYEFGIILMLSAVMLGLRYLVSSWINKEKNIVEEIALEFGWITKQVDLSDYKDCYSFSQFIKKPTKCFTGVINELPFKFFKFENGVIIIEIQDNYRFEGIYITTPDLLIRPNSFNSNLRKAEVESTKFNKYFTLYAKDSQNAYYDLDPDTIDKLTELRRHLYSMAIETYKDKLLIMMPPDSPFFNNSGMHVSYNLRKESIKRYIAKLLDYAFEIHNAFK